MLVVTVCFALVGGIVFDRFGSGVLFAFAAAMALANSAFALSIPKNRLRLHESCPDRSN